MLKPLLAPILLLLTLLTPSLSLADQASPTPPPEIQQTEARLNLTESDQIIPIFSSS